MFRLVRRQSRIAEVHEAEVAAEEQTDVDTTTDSRFLAMIAQLDTSLSDLLRTCDRIEQVVAAP